MHSPSQKFRPSMLLVTMFVLLPLTAVAQWSQPNPPDIIATSTASKVGIGVTNPNAKLDVSDSTGISRLLLSGTDVYSGQSSADGIAFRLGLNATGNRQLWIADSSLASNSTNTLFRLYLNAGFAEIAALSTNGAIEKPFIINGNNNADSKVGIGTYYPAEKLHLAGKLRLGSNGTNTDLLVFTDTAGTLNGTAYDQINSIMPTPAPVSGTTKTALHLKNAVGGGTNEISLVVDGSITAKYQDVAEWVPASEPMTPGTVVVLNDQRRNEVMPSQIAYDTRVAGVVSRQPGLILGEAAPSKATIATTGRVIVRVDASAAPIHIGDLLVSSDTPGTAMKSLPIEFGGRKLHQPGTIVGKALEPLDSGRGEILVLLTLQ